MVGNADAAGDRTAGAGRGDRGGANGDGGDPVGAAEDAVERLRRADRRYREAVSPLDEEGGVESVRRVREAHDDVRSLLEAYEDRATGSGREEFESFLEFKARVTQTVEGLDEDLPRRGAFEAARDRIDKRRLGRGDFEAARERLAPAVDLVDRLEEFEAALAEYRSARTDAEAALDAVEAHVEHLERVRELGRADLSAPVERLTEPIEAYDGAVGEAFRRFRAERPAREVLEWVEETRHFPLVEYRRPPEELLAYLRESPAGEEPVPTLLEYAEYSTSKLGHYVDGPRELKRRIATRRTYLEGLDAAPLQVELPPPPAEELRFRARELVSAVARFADDDVVARARRLRRLPEDPELAYGRLRDAVVADRRLDEADRRRVESGAVGRDIQRARSVRDDVADVLAELPER